MGDTFDDYTVQGANPARPVHKVHVGGFYMGRHEVTKALWDEVHRWAVAHGYSFEHGALGKAPNHPVHSVTWHDAVKWCNARSEKEGRMPAYYTSAALANPYRKGQVNVRNDWVRWTSGYRLPTEAEWEKAARGGVAGQRFGLGNTLTHAQANYSSMARNPVLDLTYDYDVSRTRGRHPRYDDGQPPYTGPVGSFEPNGFGLYDMEGNISERCWDWMDDNYYASSPTTDPRGPVSGSSRVLRGGSWAGNALPCSSAHRADDSGYKLGDGYSIIGFRLVLASNQPAPENQSGSGSVPAPEKSGPPESNPSPPQAGL